jgi:hypothetical protein
VTVAFFAAVRTIAAVIVAFLATYALCRVAGTGVSPAILSAALCVGLMRRTEMLTVRELPKTFGAVPLVTLGAGLIGLTFLRLPALGAALFTGGLSVAVALRRFGTVGRSVGRTIALPLLAILVVPVTLDPAKSFLVLFAVAVAAGAIAALSATAFSYAGHRPAENAKRPQRPAPDRGLAVSDRMALQMLVALALAFTIGMTVLRPHWPWVVLSAFIVCSGAVGRGDALYKAILRLGGAVAGTFVAAGVAHVTFPNAAWYAALIFLVLFAGIWLRSINYAYWAACATLIFALLQGTAAQSSLALFGQRVLCIAIGALCGVAAAWFVFPIRTKQVVRRRVADALSAMREVLGGGEPDLDHHEAELERVAPPVRLHRAIFGAGPSGDHPAEWIERTRALLVKMRASEFDRAAAGAEMRRIRDAIARRDN